MYIVVFKLYSGCSFSDMIFKYVCVCSSLSILASFNEQMINSVHALTKFLLVPIILMTKLKNLRELR